jgi:hypothetical protein
VLGDDGCFAAFSPHRGIGVSQSVEVVSCRRWPAGRLRCWWLIRRRLWSARP